MASMSQTKAQLVNYGLAQTQAAPRAERDETLPLRIQFEMIEEVSLLMSVIWLICLKSITHDAVMMRLLNHTLTT